MRRCCNALACTCDFRFASTSARFDTAVLDVDASGDMELAWSLPHLVGAAQARESLFFPEKIDFPQKIDGAQAREHRLVTRLLEPDRLHVEVIAQASHMADRHLFPVADVKPTSCPPRRMGSPTTWRSNQPAIFYATPDPSC